MALRSRVLVGAICLLLVAASLLIPVGAAYAQAEEQPKEEVNISTGHAVGFMSAAIVMGVSCLAAGYAVGKVGAAAMGACAEKPELIGRALIFVGLAEGIAIYGLIIAVMILGKM